VAAVVALATAPIGAFVALEVQVAVLTLILAGTLVLERNERWAGPAAAAMDVPFGGP
jgi:hypothetical protein